MPSSYTASARYVLEATGENLNTWGSLLNSGALVLIDFNVNGWTTKALTTDYSLTTANGAADEARSAMLKFTGTGPYTVTIPSVSKRYDVWNACTSALTVTNGSASVVLQAGEIASIVTDGSAAVKRVAPKVFDTGITVSGASSFTGALNLNASQINAVLDPTSAQDAATKAYVDATAFNMAAGALPGQTGNAGKSLLTNGSAAGWSYAVTTGAGLASVAGATLTVTASTAADVKAGTSTTTAVTPAALMGSSAHGALTDASTIAWDVRANGYNTQVTLTGTGHTVGAPTNLSDGQTVSIDINSGAGGFSLLWNAIWDFAQVGTPAMPATASKVLCVSGKYNSTSGKIRAYASQPA